MSALAQPIFLQPTPSRILAIGLAVVHLGAIMVLLNLPLPGWGKALVAIAVLVDAAHVFRRYVLFQGDAVTGVISFPDGRWMVTTRLRGECLGEPVGERLVQPWLTVLVFRLVDGRRRSLILLPDNIDAENFRRLRVRLRISQPIALVDYGKPK